MIRVKHVLKDGTQIDDITGHVVTVKDHPALYQMIMEIQRKEKQHEKSNQGNQ